MINVIYPAKMPNICWFRCLKCEDLLVMGSRTKPWIMFNDHVFKMRIFVSNIMTTMVENIFDCGDLIRELKHLFRGDCPPPIHRTSCTGTQIGIGGKLCAADSSIMRVTQRDVGLLVPLSAFALMVCGLVPLV